MFRSTIVKHQYSSSNVSYNSSSKSTESVRTVFYFILCMTRKVPATLMTSRESAPTFKRLSSVMKL